MFLPGLARAPVSPPGLLLPVSSHSLHLPLSPVIRSAFCLNPQFSDISKKRCFVFFSFFSCGEDRNMASKLFTFWPDNGIMNLPLFSNPILFQISLSLEKVMIFFFTYRGKQNCHKMRAQSYFSSSFTVWQWSLALWKPMWLCWGGGCGRLLAGFILLL